MLEVNTDSLTFEYKIETDSSNFYKPPTRFVEVKTDSLIFYKPPTHTMQ